MLKLMYAHIRTCHDGSYDTYAHEIERRFPGDGVELNEECAAFFNEQGYCLYGGGSVILSSVLGEGDEFRAALDAWDSEDICTERTDYVRRWLALFACAEGHAAKQAAARAEAIAETQRVAAGACGPQEAIAE